MSKRMARRSCGDPYPCVHPWPADCSVQCGGCDKYGYFFEAFPRSPGTFLRGNSPAGIPEAEAKAWADYQRILACPRDHANPANFERRDYRNGLGFCLGCEMTAGKIFPPAETCCRCGANTYHTQDRAGDWWCEACSDTMPEELMSEAMKWLREARAEENTLSDEELTQGIREICEGIAGRKADP